MKEENKIKKQKRIITNRDCAYTYRTLVKAEAAKKEVGGTGKVT